MILATPTDAPPAGEKRHQVRLRARGEDGDAWWAVRLSTGGLIAGAAASFAASPETIVGSWGTGAPADGSTTLYTYVTGQSNGVRITELYLDMDSRLAPTFTPQILDGSGAVTTTISDTSQPVLRADALDTDDLAARQYRYWVTLAGAQVWSTGTVSGSPVNRETTPLDNGDYVAHFQVWSTVGADTAYASDEETLAFTVSVGAIPAPDPPTVTPDLPLYSIEVCAPNVSAFDDEVGYVEIQRLDCAHGGYLELTGAAGSYASAVGDTVLNLPGGSGNYVSSPDHASLDITGDIDVRAFIQPDDWTPSPQQAILSKYNVTGNQRSYQFILRTPGQLEFTWSTNGTATVTAVSSVATGFTDGTSGWVRATLAVATGTVIFYTSTDGTNWTQLGTAQVSGVTSIFAGTATANIGARSAGTVDVFNGLFHQAEIRSGINGTIVASPRFDNLVPGATSMVDSTGKTWTLNGTASIVTPDPPTDLQIIVSAQRDDSWLPATDQTLVARYTTTGDQRAWRLSLDADGGGDPALSGRPMFVWSTDGTLANTIQAFATDRAPIDPFGRVDLRVLLDVNNGSGGWTVTFEYLDPDGEWAPVGDPVTGTPATSINPLSTAKITVGAYNAGTFEMFEGRIYSVEIRDGSAGSIIASADFTSHMVGTESFVDDAGNTWDIHPLASLTNSQTLTSIAILGPLTTDECATWVDFTLPRSGVGGTCEYEPEQCCSYYRARTVGRQDGDLRISNWSDAYDPGVPSGVIVMWPSTAASIPAGWDRVTDLDSKYLKGVPDDSTDPGTTGGVATHTHTTPGHTHDTSHLHTTTTPTAAATGTVNAPNTAGALKSLTTHTHSRPSTASATVVSGSASPGTDTENNDPARLAVVFIESDGSSLGVPNGALGLMPDIAPSGWTDYANATNRFLKGAAAAGDGGGTAASSLDSHVHAVDAHTHTGTSHAHTSANTGNFSATLAPAAGSGSVTSNAAHNHPITVASATSQALASAGGGNSGASGALDPPYRNLRVKENTSGDVDLPVGLICAWRGPIGFIPNFWQLCDGTNGTPDMFGLYPRGATASIGTAGGSAAGHTHTSPTHDHTTTGHSHTSTTGAATGSTTASTTATVAIATAAHTHALVDTASTTPTVASITSGTLAETTSEPPFEEVAFIQLVEEPTPPPEPELFCLTWNEDEHLIRTTGPDGPMWAPVLGKFDWSVDRPFTAATGLIGSRFVTSAPPGGRNMSMVAAVESEAELATLRAVLARPLVLISPSDASEVWAAPVAESVKIIRIGRIRQVTASFIGTGPEPPPQTADVGV
jgi:hypothetical protein